MGRKLVQLSYGFKLIATWMLIPFVLMFVPVLANEFSNTMTTCEVTLQNETNSSYPDEYLNFEADINGRTRVVQAPVTSKTGDKITVILINGSYYFTPKDADDIKAYTTFGGRFIRVTDNNFGKHVIGIAAVLLATFLITIKKRKEIRSAFPKLSKATDITGIICSVIMSVTMLCAIIDGTLGAIGIFYLALMLGIAYTAIFGIAWIIECNFRLRIK